MGKVLQIVKSFALFLFRKLKIARIFHYYNKDKTLILMYHGFIKTRTQGIFDNIENLHLEIEKFEEQIKYLKKNFNIISLPEFVDVFKAKGEYPDNTVILTFDDGYESNYKLAYPILKKYNCPATIFLTTNFIDKKELLWTDRLLYTILAYKEEYYSSPVLNNNSIFQINNDRDKIKLYRSLKQVLKKINQVERDKFIEIFCEEYNIQIDNSLLQSQVKPLTWEQICEMQASGLVSFGGHTCNHYIIGRLEEKIAEVELQKSKQIIEKNIGVECNLFCYPNGQPGDFTDVTKSLLKENLYTCALTTVQDFVDSDPDIFELPRLYISNRDTYNQFLISVSGLRFKN